MALNIDELGQFWRALNPALSVDADDPRYVSLHGDPDLSFSNPIEELRATIRFADDRSVQLFSGFRGTGKTSELLRLQRRLEGDGCVVIYCDMADYLNLSTAVDITDFLLSVAGAFGEKLQAPKLLGTNATQSGYLERFLQLGKRLKLNLELGGEVGISGASMKAQLKLDPTFRQRLQEQMKGHLAVLVEDVRGYFEECVKKLKDRHPCHSIVLLVDSVEQVRGTTANEREVAASLETLFFGHAEKLRIPWLHVVYTIPPWLKILIPQGGLYDGVQQLPCVQVCSRTGTPNEKATFLLRQVISLRGRWEQLLHPDDLDRVIRASGGYLRDLLRLVQVVVRLARNQQQPVPATVVDRAIQEVRSAYLPLADDDARWLCGIALSHTINLPDRDQLPKLARYFDTLLVMVYRDEEEWYDVHPLVREVVLNQGAARQKAE